MNGIGDTMNGIEEDTVNGIEEDTMNGIEEDTVNGIEEDTMDGIEEDTMNGIEEDTMRWSGGIGRTGGRTCSVPAVFDRVVSAALKRGAAYTDGSPSDLQLINFRKGRQEEGYGISGKSGDRLQRVLFLVDHLHLLNTAGNAGGCRVEIGCCQIMIEDGHAEADALAPVRRRVAGAVPRAVTG